MTVTPDLPKSEPDTKSEMKSEPVPEPIPEPDSKKKFKPVYDSPILLKCDELFGRNRGPSGSGRYSALQIHQAIEVLKVKPKSKKE